MPSPVPKRIFEIRPIRSLLEQGAVVICAGGGGIPTRYTDEPVPAGRRLVGVEAVIDKDLASALLAIDLEADALLIVTDVDAAYADWGTPEQRPIRRADPATLAERRLRRGLDGAEGAARRASSSRRPGKRAVIGSMTDTPALLAGDAGTTVTLDADGLELGPPG